MLFKRKDLQWFTRHGFGLFQQVVHFDQSSHTTVVDFRKIEAIVSREPEAYLTCVSSERAQQASQFCFLTFSGFLLASQPSCAWNLNLLYILETLFMIQVKTKVFLSYRTRTSHCRKSLTSHSPQSNRLRMAASTCCRNSLPVLLQKGNSSTWPDTRPNVSLVVGSLSLQQQGSDLSCLSFCDLRKVSLSRAI